MKPLFFFSTMLVLSSVIVYPGFPGQDAPSQPPTSEPHSNPTTQTHKRHKHKAQPYQEAQKQNPQQPNKKQPTDFKLNTDRGVFPKTFLAIQGTTVTNKSGQMLNINGTNVEPSGQTNVTLSEFQASNGNDDNCSSLRTNIVLEKLISLPVFDSHATRINDIEVPEIKMVDPSYIKQKLSQAAQSLAALNPWNGTAITSQYGALQGITNSNSFVAAQLTTAGTPSTTTTLNPNQPATQNTYTAQCPNGWVATGISVNGVVCTAQIGATPLTGSAGITQVTQSASPSPTPSSQIQTPSFIASIPTQPAITGVISPPTSIAPSAIDVLSAQVELNSDLVTYQALYSGIASDNLLISAGHIDSLRSQATLAFPISVSPYDPYKGAVAEVRVFMVPTHSSQGGLSVVNLLPASNTFNVAKATTDTKQFGAGVRIDAIGIGINASKTNSTLYLAKDTDTIALQYANPAAAHDLDERKSISRLLPRLDPLGGCDITSQANWKAKAETLRNNTQQNKEEDYYDLEKAIVFGWQFKPVLGNRDVLPIKRLFFAQVALGVQNDPAPAVFVETRWRSYDRKTGVVGRVFKNSCSWQEEGLVHAIEYTPRVSRVSTEDAGNGNLHIEAEGYFVDPNLQVRIGNAQRPPDAISGDYGRADVFVPANTFISAPNFEIVGSGGKPIPLVMPEQPSLSCNLESASVNASPFSDGTSLIDVQLTYGKNRDEKSMTPLILLGSDVYGLRDHPFLSRSRKVNTLELQFMTNVSLKSNQSLVIKDANWSQKALSETIHVQPTFTSLEPIDSTVKAAHKDYLAKGWYRIGGTNFTSMCAKCLTIESAEQPGKSLLGKAQLQVLNDSTSRLKLIEDTRSPLLFISEGGSEWVLDVKPVPLAGPIKSSPVKKGDSTSVIFTGYDFSNIVSVTFEDTTLVILAKDSKSITVLVNSKVTSSAGSKELLAVGGDGKPIILPLTVNGS